MEPYKLSHFEFRDFNNRLASLFGIDTVSGQAMWRIVWADDEQEKRLADCTPAGIQLLRPEVQLLPKYSWIKARYVLEHLVGVPEINADDLPTAKTSYEIIWSFEDKDGNFLPPNLDACKFLINLVESAVKRHKDGLTPIKKYIDEEYSQDASLEAREKRLAEYTEYLFGDQSALGGSTKTGETVIVPRTFEKGS